MKDRAMIRQRCEYCYDKIDLDQLTRLTGNFPGDEFDTVDTTVCIRCLEYLRYYWRSEAPLMWQYFRPA